MNNLKHRAKKRFGQNFLHDEYIISQIISSIELNKSDTVLEIGPGLGAITSKLEKMLDYLYLVEIDKDLVKIHENKPNIKLFNEDILKFDFSKVAESNIKIFGNLPYNISSAIFFHLINNIKYIESIVCMIQKELAYRLTASINTKSYGRLSIIMQYYFDIDYIIEVPPSSFDPMPKVDSSVIRLTPKSFRHKVSDFKVLDNILVKSFSTRRKTIKNNLKDILSIDDFKNLEIDPQKRAENLTIFDYIKITDHYVNICNR